MLTHQEIPYLQCIDKLVYIQSQEQVNRGNLIFFLTATDNQLIPFLSNRSNGIARKMFYYYEPGRYRLHLGGKFYKRDVVKTRNFTYDEVEENTDLHVYPKKYELNSTEYRNMYFNLSTYRKIWMDAMGKYNVTKQLSSFWDVFFPILSASYGVFTHKLVLIDIDNFPLGTNNRTSGQTKLLIQNPLYLLYLTVERLMDPRSTEKAFNFSTLDIDFLFFCKRKVLKINLSKCKKEDGGNLLAMIRKMYAKAETDIPEATTLQKPEEEEKIPEKVRQEPDILEKEEPLIQKQRADRIIQSSLMAANTTPVIDKLLPNTFTPTAKNSKQNLDKLKENIAELKETNPELAEKSEKAIDSAETAAKKAVIDEAKKGNITDKEEAVAAKDETTEDMLNEDQEQILQELYREMTKDTSPKSQKSSARDQMLREKQKEIVVKGMTVEQLSKINPKERKIPKDDISKSVTTTNPNMQSSSFGNFNSAYVEQVLPKDMVNIFEDLNNKSIRMFIRNIEVAETSDVQNYKETWTIHLEDENRSRHTIKVDIPKFYDKNFMWLGGNTKVIKNQKFFLPLIKINEDTAMLVTNYNKIQINRVHPKSLREIVILDGVINDGKLEDGEIKLDKCSFVPGSSTIENRDYITGLEYDEYAKRFLKFKSTKLKIFFSQKEATDYMKKYDIKEKTGHFFIGTLEGEPLFVNCDTQRCGEYSISQLISIHGLSEAENERILRDGKKVPKRLVYTKITTMKQDVPMVIILCLWEGLSTVLKKAKVEFHLENTIRKLEYGEDYIPFKNCYLIYKTTTEVELLLNGLKFLPTAQYNISDMDNEDPYIPYIQKKYGKISILNALSNVYEFTIGAIEREILRDMNYPTDLVELMILGNRLLVDNQYVNELHMGNYRIRQGEIIAAILYDTIAKAYVPFKNSNGKKKFSIPQDAVIKKMLALQTVEDYSSLNPFLELETTHGVSAKGWRGVNLEESYTVPKRSYDKSMTGLIGVSSSPDAQVGVNTTLTMEPSINSLRGYVDLKDDKLDDLKDVNLFSPAEMLIPLGATRDDPIRTGHSVKQSRASVPVKNASPVLISNGSDELCRYQLSSDFIINADQDGKVIEYDDVAKIMIVQYKDGTYRALNLDKKIVKNGGGGFELSNVLITDLKVGDTFKAHDTLAWHKEYFKKIPTQGVRMCVGAMVKVAFYSSYNTYEDANFITEKVSHMCETEMCFRVKCTLGKNSNVFRMVNVGDEVLVGDSLIDFDESFDDSEMNALLDSLGDNEELKEVILQNSRNQKKSKYSGTIEEIKIFSGSEIEDLSPSLQKIVKAYYKRIDQKHKILNKYDKSDSLVKCGMLLTESSGRTEPNRYGNIRGEKVNDGVLIEFTVKHAEPLEVGSKVANFGPLKDVVSEVIPLGYEPRSEFRPEETVDTIIGPSSILNRMVISVTITALGNKCIIELKRSLEDIWNSSTDFQSKREKMESLIYRFFTAFDKSGDNTKKYKSMFQPMSDVKFKSFFKEFFENPYHYLILDIVDYERTIQMEDIERAAKVINIPLYEYVSFPHLTMNNEEPTVTKIPIATGYIHMKRPQQTVMKKNGSSIAIDERSAITNQVTGGDKNGRESDLENSMLVGKGMHNLLKELNGPRADDSVAKQEMLQQIATTGYCSLADLTDDVTNKTTLNTVNTYFLGMSLKTDLITKGMKLPYSIKKE